MRTRHQTRRELDKLDRQILRLLQAEGRMPFTELGERIGLSTTPCTERVRRLEREGIIMGYSRQIFALARAGYLPRYFAALSPRFQTPHRALLAGGVIGVVAIFSDSWISFGGQTLTANIVTMSVFGAIVMYIMSMASLFKLRKSEPLLERPYRAPFYPVFPAIALALGVFCLGAMVWFNTLLAGVFLGLFALASAYFFLTGQQRADAPEDVMLAGSR